MMIKGIAPCHGDHAYDSMPAPCLIGNIATELALPPMTACHAIEKRCFSIHLQVPKSTFEISLEGKPSSRRD